MARDKRKIIFGLILGFFRTIFSKWTVVFDSVVLMALLPFAFLGEYFSDILHRN